MNNGIRGDTDDYRHARRSVTRFDDGGKARHDKMVEFAESDEQIEGMQSDTR